MLQEVCACAVGRVARRSCMWCRTWCESLPHVVYTLVRAA
ncbi:hypothetical protein HMPREF3190_00825 [Umbribacter vaginalis]|nr:hypothetical protein HMPREF3190_00825 [Coriobacteriales bacterium DNF00809]